MAGHSKWSKLKRIKGPLDARRGAAFSKRVKEITVAARLGGGDLSGNLRLCSLVETGVPLTCLKTTSNAPSKKARVKPKEPTTKKRLAEAISPTGPLRS